jgi:hypothetical protein
MTLRMEIGQIWCKNLGALYPNANAEDTVEYWLIISEEMAANETASGLVVEYILLNTGERRAKVFSGFTSNNFAGNPFFKLVG